MKEFLIKHKERLQLLAMGAGVVILGLLVGSWIRGTWLGYSVVTDYKSTVRASMSATQDTVPVSSLTLRDGTTLDISKLGGVVFLTLEPGKSKVEIVACTGITTSTLTFTGCTRGLAFSGTSTASVAANRKTHNAGSIVTISNVHYAYEQLTDIDTAQTVTGQWTFTSSVAFSYLPTSTTTAPTLDGQLASKKYVDDTINAGAPDGTESVKGIWEGATQSEMAAGTILGGTNAGLVLQSRYATATRTGTGHYAIITAASGYVSSTFGGVAFSMATLNSSALVVQNPASATNTPTAAGIPIADGSGKLPDGWLSSLAFPYLSLPLYENINKGEPVRFINDSGTLKLVKTLGFPSTNQTQALSGTSPSGFSVDTHGNRIVIVYATGPNTAVVAIAGTINSDNTITWGSPTTVHSGGVGGSSQSVEVLSNGYAVVTYHPSSDGHPDIRGLGISGNTISASGAQDLIATGSYNVSVITRTSDSRAIIRYDNSSNYYYRILNMSSTDTLSVETQQTGTASAVDFLLSENRIIRAVSGGFNVFTVGTDSISSVNTNSAIGTGGWKWVSYGNNTGVLGYTDNTNYYLAYISESSGTLTASKNSVVKAGTSVTAIAGGLGQEIIIASSTSQLLVNQESSLFDVKRTIASVTSFSPTIFTFSSSSKILSLEASAGTATYKFGYPDYLEMVGFVDSNGTTGESKYLISKGVYSNAPTTTIVGRNYYLQADSSVTTTSTDKYIGRSTSSTQMLLDVEIE